ncbi:MULTISPECIES: methionyl-tRNA formyltransferase [Okeania]|uniref:methionyl-tRNA formyltransferase n=1 Tax=Okeania TaxID=1458928 RepID=UPI000F53A5BF|nr:MULTISPECIES: methionyl-tRNA formyltransferase [Okeania]NEP04207.1 methionyl-tRNA formyltransferase [Okeania sp. SIO4D6]NEP40632.1 methionyl-tRNA formyltransferase [Okeania sp. SIO2H7]NET14088.1 methionyl-tRNA formyltransferase [Okeania sp. SIO1H6]NEP73813.1 methionyl-tRNA formyltransferase [Okeania sp. SIO2G5]NEP94474.1 methionyl-tRNA formyltransferase [Okeania sp. SIO2F5]
MKIIFFGTPQFAVPTLEKLLTRPEIEVVAVVTQPDKRRGRGNKLIPSPVKSLAVSHSIPVWQPRRVKKHTETLNLLRQAQVDVFVVVAYGQILSAEILDMPKLGCVNVHGSILPKYRGAAPIQWSIYHGEKETGNTTMLMDVGMDTGPMLLKSIIPIGLLDNAASVAEVLAKDGSDLLWETLLKLETGDIEPIAQDDSLATYAPLIQNSDYQIDWSRGAWEIHNQVRGFFPNCVTSFRGESLKVMATVPVGAEYWSELPPELQKLEKVWSSESEVSGSLGEVVKVIKGLGPVVQTGAGWLLLCQVQLSGKKAVSGWDFANGTRLAMGEIIGS